MTAKLSRPRSRSVDPALVQGQSMNLTWGDLASHPERVTPVAATKRSEKSAEAVVATGFGERGPPQREGPNGEESETTVDHEKATHQTSNEQLELPLEERGEAPTSRAERRSPIDVTRRRTLRSATDLMEQIVERGNLARALKRVRQNKGSPGVDGMTVDELPDYLREHWPAIREQLLTGRYQPKRGAAAARFRSRAAGCGSWAFRPCSIGSSSRPCYRSCNRALIRRSPSTATAFDRGGARTMRCARRNATCRAAGAGWWTSTWRSSLTESITTC